MAEWREEWQQRQWEEAECCRPSHCCWMDPCWTLPDAALRVSNGSQARSAEGRRDTESERVRRGVRLGQSAVAPLSHRDRQWQVRGALRLEQE